MQSDNNKEYILEQLPNGLRVVYRYVPSEVSYCGVVVNVGAREDADFGDGMAHYLEHMLFRGTTKHRDSYIANRMEQVGGELNAYTTKEETVIYSIFTKPYLRRAVNLIAEIITSSNLPEVNSQKELSIIEDEINSYRDNPSEYIYDEFENLIFDNHPLGHNILGSEDTLKTISHKGGLAFLKKFYNPNNMVLFFSGSTPYNEVKRIVNAEMPNCEEVAEYSRKRVEVEYTPFNKVIAGDSYQAHVIIGNRCFDMYNKQRAVQFFINNMLAGQGMNSILNLALREKRGYVYTVEANSISYFDSGAFSIYFGCDQKRVERCLDIINREFAKLRENRLTSTRLNALKRQFIGQMIIGQENRENVIISTGKSILYHNKALSLPQSIARVEAITANDIIDVSNQLLNPALLSTLVIK